MEYMSSASGAHVFKSNYFFESISQAYHRAQMEYIHYFLKSVILLWSANGVYAKRKWSICQAHVKRGSKYVNERASFAQICKLACSTKSTTFESIYFWKRIFEEKIKRIIATNNMCSICATLKFQGGIEPQSPDPWASTLPLSYVPNWDLSVSKLKYIQNNSCFLFS